VTKLEVRLDGNRGFEVILVTDADGNELVSSETVSGEGSTQSVEFTATEEMATVDPRSRDALERRLVRRLD